MTPPPCVHHTIYLRACRRDPLGTVSHPPAPTLRRYKTLMPPDPPLEFSMTLLAPEDEQKLNAKATDSAALDA